ncbi:MAG: methionine synthase [Phycisphaeraceae bacterium]|nr:methionine synthase [Phycisphaeraceae bacterium]
MPSRFTDELQRRVLVFDGAMGTAIHAIPLSLESDYLGRENCPEALNLTRPDVIQGIHESFLAVGADAVETNTFGGNKLVLAEFDFVDRIHEINVKAAQIARAACDKYATPDRPRFVIGSIGPGTKLITLGNTTWDEMLDSYREQVRGLIDGGVDALLIETTQDLLQIKCTINACLAALADRGKTTDDIPIMVQVTIETTGTMLLGTEIAGAAAALAGFPILSLGMNCATGPTEMAEHVHFLGKQWPKLISVLPNAGLPVLLDGKASFPLQPQPFAEALTRYVEHDGVNIVGGCCGTTPEHIRLLVQSVSGRKPTRITKELFKPACTSLFSATEFRQDTSILNIGERTNASGSRAFKKLLENEDWDGMVSLAKEQVREGSHVIDVNVDYAGRDNARDMAEIVKRFVRQVNVPLMLDSTQPKTIEAGLRLAAGKCIINSANLEDGEEKFAHMCKLAKTYGAALVLGTIDEDKEEAMARTADRKLAIARRMFDLATKKYGLAAADLFFDPLVLPISTGMEKDRRSALETIEGTRRIVKELPDCQLTCGLSNVSFGLKPAARVVLNSVFMHELIQAGMSSAIIHVSKILPRTKIEDIQWNAALDLIYNRWPDAPRTLRDGTETRDPLQIFVDLFPDQEQSEKVAKPAAASLSLEERLQQHIIDGEKRHLIETLEEARAKYSPLDIINDHLLGGMKVVGELFGSGQMQLPFVLQSAEVMKMAVAHLEQYMEKVEGQTKGKLVLATVKGDVHDIGKNLVDIILTNNGYTVFNLGIKQPISGIIEKVKEVGADAVGLSGLLVKSVGVMKENLEELNTQNITVPIILGGAALSRHYCETDLRQTYKGQVYFGRDAFEGLRLMDYLVSGRSAELNREIEERVNKRQAVEEKVEAAQRAKSQPTETESAVGAGCGCGVPHGATAAVRSEVGEAPVPVPPFWGDRVVEGLRLDDIYPFVNKVALFRGQWQFKKQRQSEAEYEAQLEDEIEPLFERLKKQCKEENILRPRVTYGYFPAGSEGDDLIVFDPQDHDRPIERFTFPRQSSRKRLCISDFFRSASSGVRDVLALSCVSMGPEVTKRERKLFDANNYSEYLYLHGMGVECAEALAELWHKRIRQELGFAGEDSPNIRELFTQSYRGSRYSFGYPACPEMSDQEKLFRLIKPERIGCTLTENWQIDPEQSTSAIIVHHPQAKYFAV